MTKPSNDNLAMRIRQQLASVCGQGITEISLAMITSAEMTSIHLMAAAAHLEDVAKRLRELAEAADVATKDGKEALDSAASGKEESAASTQPLRFLIKERSDKGHANIENLKPTNEGRNLQPLIYTLLDKICTRARDNKSRGIENQGFIITMSFEEAGLKYNSENLLKYALNSLTGIVLDASNLDDSVGRAVLVSEWIIKDEGFKFLVTPGAAFVASEDDAIGTFQEMVAALIAHHADGEPSDGETAIPTPPRLN